ncbi:MAG: 4-(cytidine 5'-diphospho)-2-C-methyl-D-erythritol kinase [Patescibacteria group bacterium]
MNIRVKSYPKINLALDILRKTPSGYHEIQTVFYQLKEPFDEITVELTRDSRVEVISNHPDLPVDQTNTVLKAAQLLQKQAGVSSGAKIFIKKRIPLMGGLGGGSSNAVAVLKVLRGFWKIQPAFLPPVADEIGMDCQFFFGGGTALGEHFGEKIAPLPSPPSSIKFELIETGVKISSKLAYEKIDFKGCGKNIHKTKKLIAALHAQDAHAILENLHNDFEEFIFGVYPQLVKIKKREESQNHAGRILLCGSGGALCRVSIRD